MSDFPLEMSDDARIWLNRTLQQLENGLQSESQFLPSFSDPNEPVWAIFVARELTESWETYVAAESRFAHASLERLIQRVAQWLRAGLRVTLSNFRSVDYGEVPLLIWSSHSFCIAFLNSGASGCFIA